jgi:hypothetical protein
MGFLVGEIERFGERCLTVLVVVVQTTNVQLNNSTNLCCDLFDNFSFDL